MKQQQPLSAQRQWLPSLCSSRQLCAPKIRYTPPGIFFNSSSDEFVFTNLCYEAFFALFALSTPNVVVVVMMCAGGGGTWCCWWLLLNLVGIWLVLAGLIRRGFLLPWTTTLLYYLSFYEGEEKKCRAERRTSTRREPSFLCPLFSFTLLAFYIISSSGAALTDGPVSSGLIEIFNCHNQMIIIDHYNARDYHTPRTYALLMMTAGRLLLLL